MGHNYEECFAKDGLWCECDTCQHSRRKQHDCIIVSQGRELSTKYAALSTKVEYLMDRVAMLEEMLGGRQP